MTVQGPDRNAGLAGISISQARFLAMLTVAGAGGLSALGGMSNPMTTNGDMIVRAGGAPARLAPGTNTHVLTMTAGAPVWAAPAAGYVDPLTTNGDLVVRSGGVTTRLGTAGAPDGGVFTVVGGAPQWAAAPSSGPTITTYYASDFTAENGSESASISGTGPSSTATLTASSTARLYTPAAMTVGRVILPLPAGVREIEVTYRLSTVSNWATGGNRYLVVAVRDPTTASNPTTMFGLSWADSGFVRMGSMTEGANSSSYYVYAPVALIAGGALRWTFKPREPFAGFLVADNTTAWVPPRDSVPGAITHNGATTPRCVPDPDTASALVLFIQSFGALPVSTLTGTLTVRVVTE